MADVLMDTIAPTLYVLNGVQQYASVDKPHLKTIGWFAENSEGVYRSLRAAGIAMVDQYGKPAEGEDAPRSAGGGAMPLYFTVPESAGLRHEVLPDFPFGLDHRNAPGWTAPASPEGPLGLERCAFHTLLTDDPQRALHTLVDALGGTVFHQGRDEVIGADASYVHLADTVLQVAVPDQGTAAYADWTTTAPTRHLPLAHLQGRRPGPGRRAPEVPGRRHPLQDRGHPGDRPRDQPQRPVGVHHRPGARRPPCLTWSPSPSSTGPR